MAFRGAGGGTWAKRAPRRRRPDWDNTLHDLKTLKLTPAELEARSRAFRSKDWSQTRRSCSRGSNDAHSEDGTKSEDADDMRRITVQEECAVLKRSRSSESSTSSDDFDEDIRRLESLQYCYPEKRTVSSEDFVQNRCSQQFVRASPNLLQYLETEMQKAWSEMSLKKKRLPTRKIKRRMKLQIGLRKSQKTDAKMLNMILANQRSTALATNQSFIQELERHVEYQQRVIQELNEFRICATRELTNLVVLVQKMLSIHECNISTKQLPGHESGHQEREAMEAKVGNDKVDSADASTVDLNGTPPKPRNVPAYLKQRASMAQPAPRLQLQDANQGPSSLREEGRNGNTNLPPAGIRSARLTENKRRLPPTFVPKSTDGVDNAQPADKFDRRENPLFESEVHGKCAAPFKKSRLQDQASSPTWKAMQQEPRIPDTQDEDKVTIRRKAGTDNPGGAAPNKSVEQSTIYIPAKKPSLEQARTCKNSALQQPAVEQPGKLAQTQGHLQKFANKKLNGAPTYKLQGWSAAFLQTERSRGKENTAEKVGARRKGPT